MSFSGGLFLGVACGGAVGAMARFALSTWVYRWWGSAFPVGTLVVNVFGSLLMGVLTILLVERLNLGGEWRAVILVGFLGSFTTFSTFSMETYHLLVDGEYWKAATNMIASVGLCVGGYAAGVTIARQL